MKLPSMVEDTKEKGSSDKKENPSAQPQCFKQESYECDQNSDIMEKGLPYPSYSTQRTVFSVAKKKVYYNMK